MPKNPLYALSVALIVATAALGEPAAKPVVYNNLEGDGGVELDRSIKQAYSGKYKIVDTRRADGYVEPKAVAGELPRYVKDQRGQLIVGYVLAAYIVTADGAVADPVMVKWSDERLCKVAVEAMADWRFMPGTLKGLAVATTAAQEFNFGPSDASNGFQMERVVVYQPNDIVTKRMPPGESSRAYVELVQQVAHNFFVGDTVPETFSIVIITRPGRRSKVWFVSSYRPGNSPELEPLRRLLEAVPPMNVRDGPVILGLTALIAGGDGKDRPVGADYRNPIPAEWLAATSGLKQPPTFASDAYIDLVWPDAP
jgi:hypothetical protein